MKGFYLHLLIFSFNCWILFSFYFLLLCLGLFFFYFFPPAKCWHKWLVDWAWLAGFSQKSIAQHKKHIFLLWDHRCSVYLSKLFNLLGQCYKLPFCLYFFHGKLLFLPVFSVEGSVYSGLDSSKGCLAFIWVQVCKCWTFLVVKGNECIRPITVFQGCNWPSQRSDIPLILIIYFAIYISFSGLKSSGYVPPDKHL